MWRHVAWFRRAVGVKVVATILSASAVLWTAGSAHALRTFPALVPNTVETLSDLTGAERPCITCHNNPDGGRGCDDGSGLPSRTPPCLNPFGMAFRHSDVPGTMDKKWTMALAMLDSDGDGFTNGQELGDRDGTWSFGQPRPGNPDQITAPGNRMDSPGLHDVDGDGLCWEGTDTDDDGQCVSAGEPEGGFDCDDDDETVNSLQPEDCSNDVDNDCDGRVSLVDDDCDSVVDNDGDGVCEQGTDLNGDRNCVGVGEDDGAIDCDDDRVNDYPGAPEHCLDGRDNDCDELVDAADPTCDTVDLDGDGYCPLGRDGNGDGDCADPGEDEAVSDCDETDTGVSPVGTEADDLAACIDRKDNDCDADADLDDTGCATFVDQDGDGFCPAGRDLDRNGSCTDEGAGELGGDVDCDDVSEVAASVSPLETEDCTDGRDNDCDGDVDTFDVDCADFLDLDDDGFCVVGEDLDDDGACVSDGELNLDRSDCDDINPNISPNATEDESDGCVSPAACSCADTIDNDCDGLTDGRDDGCDGFADKDGDGYCAVGEDMNGDGDCADIGERLPAGDCDDESPLVSPVAREHCFDTLDNDCDGLTDGCPVDEPLCSDTTVDGDCSGETDGDHDGYCPVGADDNGDGDCLDEGERREVTDCNDADPAISPDAAEVTAEACVDRRDNDCDSVADEDDPDCDLFRDGDGDLYCGQGRDRNRDGDCLDEGEQDGTADCDDADIDLFPGNREQCGDELDNDCDGLVDTADDCLCTENAQCVVACGTAACVEGRCQITSLTGCDDAGVVADGSLDFGSAPPCSIAVAPGVRGRRLPLVLILGVGVAIVALRRRRRRSASDS